MEHEDFVNMVESNEFEIDFNQDLKKLHLGKSKEIEFHFKENRQFLAQRIIDVASSGNINILLNRDKEKRRFTGKMELRIDEGNYFLVLKNVQITRIQN